MCCEGFFFFFIFLFFFLLLPNWPVLEQRAAGLCGSLIISARESLLLTADTVYIIFLICCLKKRNQCKLYVWFSTSVLWLQFFSQAFSQVSPFVLYFMLAVNQFLLQL